MMWPGRADARAEVRVAELYTETTVPEEPVVVTGDAVVDDPVDVLVPVVAPVSVQVGFRHCACEQANDFEC
jgi:hypothetical protein